MVKGGLFFSPWLDSTRKTCLRHEETVRESMRFKDGQKGRSWKKLYN